MLRSTILSLCIVLCDMHCVPSSLTLLFQEPETQVMTAFQNLRLESDQGQQTQPILPDTC